MTFLFFFYLVYLQLFIFMYTFTFTYLKPILFCYRKAENRKQFNCYFFRLLWKKTFFEDQINFNANTTLVAFSRWNLGLCFFTSKKEDSTVKSQKWLQTICSSIYAISGTKYVSCWSVITWFLVLLTINLTRDNLRSYIFLFQKTREIKTLIRSPLIKFIFNYTRNNAIISTNCETGTLNNFFCNTL